MSYGQNLPWGLQATKTLTGATWDGAVNPYLIAPGYAQNIFRGDLVAILPSGYIINLSDANVGGTAFTDCPALGVFNGCSYVTPTSANPIDPASPGRPYWPSGTITSGNVPAVAFVIDDPSVVFNVQTNGPGGIPQNGIFANYAVAYNLVGGQVQGNFQTGVSEMVLDQGTASASVTRNLFARGFVPYTGNVASTPYNNVEVIIQNHQFATRPAGQ